MRYLLYPIIICAISVLATYQYLTQQAGGGGLFALALLYIVAIIGLILGLLLAYAQKRYRTIALSLFASYVVLLSAYSGVVFFKHDLVPNCAGRVIKQFNREPDIALLDSWCIRKKDGGVFFKVAEKRVDNSLFDKILAKGFLHNNLDCAHLKFAIARGDLESINTLIAKGTSPQCKSFRQSPMDVFQDKQNHLKDKPALQAQVFNVLAKHLKTTPVISGSLDPARIQLLISAGSEVTLKVVLNAINVRNHAGLQTLIKNFDLNAYDNSFISTDNQPDIKHPLALAIHNADIDAVRILIDAGADKNQQLIIKKFKGNAVWEKVNYTLQQYAHKQRDAAYSEYQDSKSRRPDGFRKIKLTQLEQIVGLIDPASKQPAVSHAVVEEEAIDTSKFKPALLTFTDKEREIFFRDKPVSTNRIKVFTGRLYRFEYKKITFRIYSKPSQESEVFLEKLSGSLDLKKGDGSLYCSFDKNEGKQKSCLDMLQVIHSHFDPPFYYLLYSDKVTDAKKKQKWYRVKFGDIEGWHVSPYSFFSSDPYLLSNAKPVGKIAYHPGHIVQPAKNTIFYTDLDSLKTLDISFDHKTMHLIVEGNSAKIHWRDNKPYVEVGIAKLDNLFNFCFQKNQPKVFARGYIELLNAKGKFNVARLDLREMSCD